MSGLPTLAVFLESAAGTFVTHNITAYVELASGWGFRRGRNDEDDAVEPGTANFTLNNSDGRFTFGASNYDGITTDKRIQVKETVGGVTYIRFTGYVQDWPTEWESAVGNVAKARITAVDRQARLNRRKLRAMIEHEVLTDAPLAYYRLSEPAGAVSAGDFSGQAVTVVAVPEAGFAGSTTTTAPAFGVTLASSAYTGAQFFDGQHLNAPMSLASATALTIECLVATTDVTAGGLLFDFGTESQVGAGTFVAILGVNTSPGFTVTATGGGFSSSTPINDGALHHVALTITAAGVITAYVDGVSAGSTAGSASTVTATHLRMGSRLTGVVAHVGVYDSALSAARIAAHASAALNGFTGERSDERVARLLGYANIATADQALETGLATIAASVTDGRSVTDAVAEVVKAEGGLFFIAGDGKSTLHNRAHRVLKALGTPTSFVGADVDPGSFEFAADKDYLVNTATGSRPNGAEQRVVNATSLARYEEYPSDNGSLLLTADDRVLDLLNWQVGSYGTVASRVSTVTFDLMTLTQAQVQSLLALELGDCVSISSIPSQAPSSTVRLIVEGLKEDQSLSSSSSKWTLTLNTAPASLFYAPIVDTASATVNTGYPVYF